MHHWLKTTKAPVSDFCCQIKKDKFSSSHFTCILQIDEKFLFCFTVLHARWPFNFFCHFSSTFMLWCNVGNSTWIKLQLSHLVCWRFHLKMRTSFDGLEKEKSNWHNLGCATQVASFLIRSLNGWQKNYLISKLTKDGKVLRD